MTAFLRLARVVLLLAVIAARCGHTAVAAVTCARILSPTASIITDLPTLRGCLRALPVNQTFNAEVAATALLGVQLHSLSPYITSSYKAIANLATQTNLNEFDFLRATKAAYSSAQDPHFTVRGPPFYDNVYSIRLLRFGSRLITDAAVTNATSQQIYVASTVGSNYQTLLGMWQSTETFPTSGAIAATEMKNVSTINGIPALQWARKVARVAGYKDDSANLNTALQTGFFTRLLDDPEVERSQDIITFTDGTSIVMPGMTYILPTVTKSYRCDLRPGTSGATHARREAPAVSPDGSPASGAKPKLWLNPDAARLIGMVRIGSHDAKLQAIVNEVLQPVAGAAAVTQASQTSAVQSSVTVVGSVSGFGTASLVTNAAGKTIALLRLTSFHPPGELIDIGDDVLTMVANLLARSAGVTTELAIDVCGNGGGFIALGDLVLRALDAAYNMDVSVTDQQPINPTAKNTIVCESYIRQSVLQSPKFSRYWFAKLNSSSFVGITPQMRTYKTATATATKPWWSNPERLLNDFYTPRYTYMVWGSLPAPIQPYKRIRVLSDGVCGSTCCHFVQRLAMYGVAGTKVELVGFGGFFGDPYVQMSDFCGGSVKSLSCELSDASLTKHPYLTGVQLRDDIDFGFTENAVVKDSTTATPLQYDTANLAFATKQYYDWTAIGNSEDSQLRRVHLAYADVSFAVPRYVPGVFPAMVLAVLALALL